jgi:hypothetical protein
MLSKGSVIYMSSSNRRAKEQLIMLYGARDMLTGQEASASNLTFHHTWTKAVNGGSASVKNGSNLLPHTHEWLTELESKNRERYWLINECIMNYKEALDKHDLCLIMEYEAEIMLEIEEEVKKYTYKRR